MNIILTLTLTGSCMAISYCLMKLLPKRYIGHHWGYIWLKITMLFYLIPLPYLKKVYRTINRYLFDIENYTQSSYFNDFHDNGVYQFEGKTFINTSYRIQIIICTIWFTVATLILICYIFRYLHQRRILLECCERNNDKRSEMILEELKHEFGIRRHVMLYYSNQKITPFCLGIWKPIIILYKESLNESFDVIIKHELVHIKRYDTIFQVLDLFLLSIHWFNPLVHWVIKEKKQICEMSCDDAIANFMSLNERAEYASLITRHATYGNQQVAWANNFSKGGAHMEKRMVNIMGKNKKIKLQGLLSVLLIGFVTILSSLTVFAYKDVTYINILNSKILKSESESQFIPYGDAEGFGWNVSNPVIMYEKQFIDIHGNIYDVTDPAKTYVKCKHVYQYGEYQQHIKNTGESCTIDTYNAKRCISCGSMVPLDIITSIIFYSCSH